MSFQQDADIFTHGATIGAGLPGQIVVEGFGQVQLDIAVALEAATLFRRGRESREGMNGGTFGHGGGFRATPRKLRAAWPQLPGLIGWGYSRRSLISPYQPRHGTGARPHA
jgi:hypothetical protein